MKEIIITDKNAGGRLDKILFRYLDKASGGFIYKMLRKKNITLNDKKASGSEIVEAGDSVKLYLADDTVAKFKSGLSVREAREAGNTAGRYKKEESASKTVQRPLHWISLKNNIVFEDRNILAINKPVGVLSQKARPEDMSVNDFVLEHIPSDEFFTPGICNRLDRNTSGIVLAGKNLNAARELNRAIAGRDISKKYICLVGGVVSEDRVIDGWLFKDEKNNKVTITEKEAEGADRIITGYKVIASNDRVTLLEVDLITGKSHQIRAHLASTGHPVIGDTKYGDSEANAYYRESFKLKSQLLHACKLEFRSASGILEYLNGTVIKAELPLKFKKVLEAENLLKAYEEIS